MLLQVVGRKIYLFPAWPKTWDVNFKLHPLYNTTDKGEEITVIVGKQQHKTTAGDE